MKRWRDFNRAITMMCARGSELVCDDELKYYEDAPYAWMMLLVPIAGIAFFSGVGVEGRLEERRRKRK